MYMATAVQSSGIRGMRFSSRYVFALVLVLVVPGLFESKSHFAEQTFFSTEQ